MVRGLLNRRGLAALGAAAVALLAVTSTPAASGPARPASFRLSAFRSILDGRVAGLRTARSAAADECGQDPELQCLQVAVPLDRSGQVPGTISLHVEVVPAQGTPRGAMFLIAGGPGQGSAHVFDLGSPDSAALFRVLFPGYTLVAYDDRGTGESGLIDCPAVQAAITADQQRAAATQCGQQLGASSPFYSTADHAEDLEAVRQALGFDKIALFGVSYGTKLAMAYALAHPDHVERLLLDSVLPPEEPDPYSATVLRDLPEKLDAFCSNGGCRAATASYSGDVVAVANALAAKPLSGKVLLPNGAFQAKTVDGLDFLSTVLEADLNPGLAAELPAVVHAARTGNTQPLLRLVYLHDRAGVTPSIELSGGLYEATVCRDGPFPWAPDTPVDQRLAILQSAIAALPAGTFGPFGKWAARFGNSDSCVDWPSPSGGDTLGPGPLPNVPVLALSGGIDMRTPTEGAQDVVSRFPQGELLVVPGVGHSVTTADPSGCAIQAIISWMGGANVAGTCPRAAAILAPIPALPAAVPKPAPLGPLQTYSVAAKTLADAEGMWLNALASSPATIAGIYSGRLVPTLGSIVLSRYSVSRGITLSGTLHVAIGTPTHFTGTVTVAGANAATGILGLKGSSLRGTLGGRIVGR